MKRQEFATVYLKVRLEVSDYENPGAIKRERVVRQFVKFLKEQKFDQNGVLVQVYEVT